MNRGGEYCRDETDDSSFHPVCSRRSENVAAGGMRGNASSGLELKSLNNVTSISKEEVQKFLGNIRTIGRDLRR
ncbi:961_t:CDS:2 [Ambispora gerdemannii]|uniref:961_t:CDS:1 n=1 Tax=Ambispora gerdemannii TaxID=144530 RepID=A0A9N8Z282_9GLOM|nr:961_t:CDS:2 [Ambispora gerdemannii]